MCRQAVASRELSMEHRTDIDSLINDAARDMLGHWTNTNRSVILYLDEGRE